MATREELMDPDFVPYQGELRWIECRGHRKLQQYQAAMGWHDIPELPESEIPRGRMPNCKNLKPDG